jgi:hypothetical protein
MKYIKATGCHDCAKRLLRKVGSMCAELPFVDNITEHAKAKTIHPDCKLDDLEEIYNAGYHNGHNDTVECQYTHIFPQDMKTYHAEVVKELLDEYNILKEGKK